MLSLKLSKLGQSMRVSPASVDAQVILTRDLTPYGVKVELVSDAEGRYGLTSGRRFPSEDRPPMTPEGERLFGEFSVLTHKGAQLNRALDADLDRQIRRGR